MSLILDALKKLEREKETPDRGFLVLSHLPWALGRQHSFTAAALVLLAAGLLAGGGLGLWIANRGKAPARPSAGEHTPKAADAEAADAEEAPSAGPAPALDVPPPRSPAAPAIAAALPAATARPSPGAAGEERTAGPTKPGEEAGPSDRASATPSKPASEFRLNAIAEQDGHPVAILNDRLVREGDTFGDIRIVRIGEAEVEIEVHGERKVIRF